MGLLKKSIKKSSADSIKHVPTESGAVCLTCINRNRAAISKVVDGVCLTCKRMNTKQQLV